MAKIIRVEDSGHVWHVPLEAVAKNRAEYYAKRDPNTTFESEYEYVMEDDHEGVDWFQNNMDFKDVAGEAKLVATPKPLKEPRPSHSDCELIEQ